MGLFVSAIKKTRFSEYSVCYHATAPCTRPTHRVLDLIHPQPLVNGASVYPIQIIQVIHFSMRTETQHVVTSGGHTRPHRVQTVVHFTCDLRTCLLTVTTAINEQINIITRDSRATIPRVSLFHAYGTWKPPIACVSVNDPKFFQHAPVKPRSVSEHEIPLTTVVVVVRHRSRRR